MKTKAIPVLLVAALIGFFIFAPTIVSAETVEEWNKQGISFFTSGEYEHAIECFDTAIEQNPNLDVPYSNRGAVYFYSKQYESAIADYNKSIALNPNDAKAYNQRARAYLALKQYESAIDDYSNVIELFPDYAEGYNNRGTAYFYSQQYESAIEDYNKTIELNPDDAQAYNNRGTAYFYLQQYESAIEDYNKAIELDPHLTPAYANCEHARSKLNHEFEAIFGIVGLLAIVCLMAVVRTKAIPIIPIVMIALIVMPFFAPIAGAETVEDWNRKGTGFYKLGEYERAIDCFEKVIGLNPYYAAEGYNNRGTVYFELKQYERAIADYNKSIALEPNDAETYNNRGRVYAVLEQYERAVADYNRAIERNANYAEAYKNRGTAYFALEEYERAMDDFAIADTVDDGSVTGPEIVAARSSYQLERIDVTPCEIPIEAVGTATGGAIFQYGEYFATTESDFIITATGTVYAQSLVSIDLVPATATMGVGDQRQFLAVGKDGQGGTVVLVDPRWSTNGGATLIPIADTCIVRADQTGRYTLTCREGGTTIEGDAKIEITDNLASIEIDPANVTLNVGNTQIFNAIGKDQYGNPVFISNPQWMTTGGGTIDSNGSQCTFTATTAGDYTITCEQDGVQGTANIGVIDPQELTSIEIQPDNVTLNVGDQQIFNAIGKDQYGNVMPLTNPQWATTGGGTIVPNGSQCTYTATTAGDYTITCEDASGVQGTANIHITGTPVETATGSGTAYFATDAGTLENLAAVDESTLPEEGKPALVFPHGFFSFNITGLTPCAHQKVVVTITLPSAVPVGTEYWKYHASEGGWVQIPMGSDDGDAVITITLEDGGLGDDDGECNGVIVDSGGPGVVPAEVFDTGSPANRIRASPARTAAQ